MPKPTLSKSLKNCGNWFQKLERHENQWRASAMDNTVVSFGDTPEDAMDDLTNKLKEKKAI